ncbi:hypothetical protein J8TS2_06630 [Lederbergia ruris]|uniref:Integrase n=1 Tax=Lederbergia ruris TaxID=217495 RepID=A0ABQ4KEE7_9BACI|nr:integrase [Lederbergia ruris]GIN56344.1 hypothetical protein J8TS2_06630 [Lederbergia ruris]
MNRRILSKQIKGWIREIMETVQLPMPIKQRSTGVNMSYNFLDNLISFNPTRLIHSHKEMCQSIPFRSFVQTLTLHELGHSLDRDALFASIPKSYHIYQIKKAHPYSERRKNMELFQWDLEEHEMNYVFEETAWLNARTLNQIYQIVDWPIMEEVEWNSLLTYTAQYNRDLLIYHKLKVAIVEPIAI